MKSLCMTTSIARKDNLLMAVYLGYSQFGAVIPLLLNTKYSNQENYCLKYKILENASWTITEVFFSDNVFLNESHHTLPEILTTH